MYALSPYSSYPFAKVMFKAYGLVAEWNKREPQLHLEMEDPYRFLVLRFHKIFDSEKILEEIDSKDIIGNPLKVLNDEEQSRLFAEDAEHDE